MDTVTNGSGNRVKKYWITVEDRGGGFYCPEDTIVMDAMRKSGHGPVRYGCFGGGCGVCKMQLVSGKVHFAKKMSRAHISEEEEQRGLVLICCIRPTEDIVLREIANT